MRHTFHGLRQKNNTKPILKVKASMVLNNVNVKFTKLLPRCQDMFQHVSTLVSEPKFTIVTRLTCSKGDQQGQGSGQGAPNLGAGMSPPSTNNACYGKPTAALREKHSTDSYNWLSIAVLN